MKALILINFKLYKEAAGKKGLALAKKISKVKSSKYKIAIAPSLLTLQKINEKTNIKTFSQHTSHVELGSHTGRISAQELKALGIKGTILNHSERRIPKQFLKQAIKNCQKYKLSTVVCARNLSEIKKLAKFKPTYIAYEPKKLIGGNISVTAANPKIIQKAVKIYSNLLVGAGVHSRKDIQTAIKLGAKGVLIGHAVPKAKNPKKFLEGMLK
tara:strand:- start:39412 stop:40050 length:639 start_codon:yes stop_codon:yes gene_type:complete